MSRGVGLWGLGLGLWGFRVLRCSRGKDCDAIPLIQSADTEQLHLNISQTPKKKSAQRARSHHSSDQPLECWLTVQQLFSTGESPQRITRIHESLPLESSDIATRQTEEHHSLGCPEPTRMQHNRGPSCQMGTIRVL